MKTLQDCENCQLQDCQKNCKLKVVKLHAPRDLKQRLISFGIMKGSMIEIIQHSTGKSTIEIKVGKMKIALRSEEAKLVEVEKI